MRFFRGNFGYRIARFLSGRNGPDTIYYVTFVFALVCSLSQWFIPSFVPTLLSAVAIGYALFRAFSRNIARRRAENAAFCRFFYNLFHPRTRRPKPPKTHVFRKCPNCKSKLRLRYVPGKHSVRCPRCNILFDIKIR